MTELSKIRSEAGRKGGKASTDAKRKAVRSNAALGGSVSSEAKAEAARANGKKGGRPRKS